jgi:hypothetical protein
MQFMHDKQREAVTCGSWSTGIAIGHDLAHRPQSMQASLFRLIRPRPNREKGFRAAANGQNQRQNGIVTTSDAAAMLPATT